MLFVVDPCVCGPPVTDPPAATCCCTAWVSCGLVVVAVHSAFNGNYGFHRDELATLDDARQLAWGYVA